MSYMDLSGNINSACCVTHINPVQPKGQTLYNQHAFCVDMQTGIVLGIKTSSHLKCCAVYA